LTCLITEVIGRAMPVVPLDHLLGCQHCQIVIAEWLAGLTP